MGHPWVGRSDVVNLGVLTQFVPPWLVDGAIAGRTRDRARRVGPISMRFAAYYELALALFAQESYEQVCENLIESIPALAGLLPAKSALLGARRRLGPEAVRAIFEQVAGAPVASPDTIGARWHGLRVLGVDGMVVAMPETGANRAHFGGPTAMRRKVIEIAGQPQARVVALVECGTRAPVAASIGTYHHDERVLAEDLCKHVGPGDVVVFDRGFPKVALWQCFAATGAKIVMRAATGIGTRIVQELPDGSYLAEIRVDKRATSPSITVRVIEYQAGSATTIRLLTNTLEPDLYPAEQIAALYRERWQHEIANLQLKTLQIRRGKVPLRSGNPDEVYQELWAHLTVNNALTRLSTLIADERRQDPERVSFTQILAKARRTVTTQAHAALHTLAHTARAITSDIADDLRRYRNPAREPRTSERSIKSARQRYPYRRPGTTNQPVTRKTTPTTIKLLPHPN